MLIPIGLAYALIYYMTFSYAIRHFNLRTPGRDKEQPLVAQVSADVAMIFWRRSVGAKISPLLMHVGCVCV